MCDILYLFNQNTIIEYINAGAYPDLIYSLITPLGKLESLQVLRISYTSLFLLLIANCRIDDAMITSIITSLLAIESISISALDLRNNNNCYIFYSFQYY